jgi:hypothetical protein
MIHEVDAAIRAMIRRDAVNGGDVEVAFDAPTKEWAAKRTAPTVDVYLFDIREDVARRRVEREPVRDDEGAIIGRRRPPRRYRLSYLITAWTQRPEDEHRLLSAVLHAFLPLEEIPRDLFEGNGTLQEQPVFCTIGLPPPPERSIGEIWSAMGGELKPSLELVLSAPFILGELQHAGPPVEEQPRFTFEDIDGRVDAPHLKKRTFSVPVAPSGKGANGAKGGKGAKGGAKGRERRTGEIAETIAAGKGEPGKEAGRIITITTIDR